MSAERLLLEYNTCHNTSIEAIVGPFLQLMGLTTFGYQRFFPDGRHFSVFNNLGWATYYLNTVTTGGENFLKDNQALLNGEIVPVLWPTLTTDPIIAALHQHDIWHGISFYRLTDGVLDAWEFSTTRERTQVHSSYVAHGLQFRHFIDYFERAIQPIFSKANMSLYPQFTDNHFSTWTKPGHSQFDSKTLMGALGLVTLSPQEWSCSQQLTHGLSTKEIGRTLNLSPKTVEEYLTNAKKKLGVHKSTELVRYIVS